MPDVSVVDCVYKIKLCHNPKYIFRSLFCTEQVPA